MHFGFFVLLLSTDCCSQPASALHSHISMCKFDLFLGKYHQTESCFWASSPSKGTRSFSSQAWHGRSPPTLAMLITTVQCGNDGSGCQSSGNHSFSKYEGGILEKSVRTNRMVVLLHTLLFFGVGWGLEILQCLWVWGWLMFIASKWAPHTRRDNLQ